MLSDGIADAFLPADATGHTSRLLHRLSLVANSRLRISNGRQNCLSLGLCMEIMKESATDHMVPANKEQWLAAKFTEVLTCSIIY